MSDPTREALGELAELECRYDVYPEELDPAQLIKARNAAAGADVWQPGLYEWSEPSLDHEVEHDNAIARLERAEDAVLIAVARIHLAHGAHPKETLSMLREFIDQRMPYKRPEETADEMSAGALILAAWRTYRALISTGYPSDAAWDELQEAVALVPEVPQDRHGEPVDLSKRKWALGERDPEAYAQARAWALLEHRSLEQAHYLSARDAVTLARMRNQRGMRGAPFTLEWDGLGPTFRVISEADTSSCAAGLDAGLEVSVVEYLDHGTEQYEAVFGTRDWRLAEEVAVVHRDYARELVREVGGDPEAEHVRVRRVTLGEFERIRGDGEDPGPLERVRSAHEEAVRLQAGGPLSPQEISRELICAWVINAPKGELTALLEHRGSPPSLQAFANAVQDLKPSDIVHIVEDLDGAEQSDLEAVCVFGTRDETLAEEVAVVHRNAEGKRRAEDRVRVRSVPFKQFVAIQIAQGDVGPGALDRVRSAQQEADILNCPLDQLDSECGKGER